MRKVFAKGLGLPLIVFGFSAHAIPIVGTSGGFFSNLSDCDKSLSDGDGKNCRIVNTDANGSNTQVEWGSRSSSTDFYIPSTLTSVGLNIDTNTDSGLGVVIGRLDWYNSATRATSDLNDLAVRWTLSLSFTSPSGPYPDTHGNEVFDLEIINPLNPPGDEIYGLSLAALNSLDDPVNLAGVSISNLRYWLLDPAGGGTSSFSNNYWYNDENNSSTLLILADFRPRAVQVPEPTMLSLLGLGLLSLAAGVRRRRR